jgi:diguanylate cyclase (GGDEF)-like protein
MSLDGQTVLFDTTILAATVGSLLVINGSKKAGEQSLRLWGYGYLIGGFSAVLFSGRGIWSDFWTIIVANTCLALCYGLQWAGARRFVRRTANSGFVAAGALVWLTACTSDVFVATPAARIILSSTVAAIYLAGAAWEFLRLAEPLPSRRLLAILLLIHAMAYLVRVPIAILHPPLPGTNMATSPWFLTVTIEAMIHLVASGMLLVALAKERAESRVQRLAEVDSLTGVSNRRAFLEQAAQLRTRCHVGGRPAAILMIDIDHFKQVNDTLGHRAGDEILQRVGAVLRGSLRPTDLCGRIGGEEFACFLADCRHDQAMLTAERLRAAVLASQLGGISVSIGVAGTDAMGQQAGIDDLMIAADRALYASKSDGRNRVTVARAA